MPLASGSSKEVIASNIKEMEASGHPHKQALAAALHNVFDAHAAGILLTHGSRALFLKRSEKSRDHAGEWCCPGGSLEDGETPRQAARREMQEETGLTGLIAGDLSQIDNGNGFITFRQTVDDEPLAVLNDEHTEYQWAPMDAPPQPLHPGVAATLKKLLSIEGALDLREWDTNGWFTVLDNPLSCIGVYPYSEASVKKDGDRNKKVNVFRPPEELSDPETVKSFRLMPWTDDHPDALLGEAAHGLVPPEEKGIAGVIGEQTYYRDGTLYGNIKVFSEQLARKIAAGKRELSCGYRCDFIPEEGVYEGVPYQYVQKARRGNHVSSVDAGRMGAAVRVLDAAERFTFALDLKEAPVRKDEQDCSVDADTEQFIADSFNSLVGELEKKGYSKEYATKVAGKIAAEKGKTGHDSIGNSTEVTIMANGKDDKGDVKDPVKKDDKPSDLASPGGKDSMTEEEGMDAKQDESDKMEATKDADEEKADKDKDDKEARDRKSARDRRAGARDERASARDSRKSARDSARDAKAAKDAAEAAKGKGMDAAAVTELVRQEVSKVKVPSTEEIVAQVRPAIRREEAAKATLYGRVSPLIGAFDHAEMTHVEMATYSLDKLGAPKAPADPVTALDFWLAGRGQAAEPIRSSALDSASNGAAFLDIYLTAASA